MHIFHWAFTLEHVNAAYIQLARRLLSSAGEEANLKGPAVGTA